MRYFPPSWFCGLAWFVAVVVSCSFSSAEEHTPPYESESFIEGVQGEKTGFFHVEEQGETWWMIDPMGRGFVPLGVDHVRYSGHYCHKLGYAPYHKKNQQRYENQEAWARETLDRLQAWGFNTLGASASHVLYHRGLAHTEFISFGGRFTRKGETFEITPHEGRPCSAFPNVFHPEFEPFCEEMAQKQCAKNAADPWLLGYFLDNELAWWGRGALDTGLFDAVMKKSADHTAKRALRDFLSEKYGGDVQRFNQAWDCRLKSFEALLGLSELTGRNAETVTSDKSAFAGLAADRYFGAARRAIRKVDPNHMLLGCRFAGGHAPESVWACAGRHCELLTFNYYGNVNLRYGVALDHDSPWTGKPLLEPFERFYHLGGRPMMVTEWSFPALDSGLPCTHGAGQRFRTQQERARATEIFARTMLRMPFLLGYDYFMWVDEPALGISDAFPENTNYGLINEDGKPYSPIVDMFTRLHRQAGRLRNAGPAEAPLVQTPDTAPVEFKKPTAVATFKREGEDFHLQAGKWEFEGRLGSSNLLDRVVFDGVPLGRYTAMVQQVASRNLWVAANRLVEISPVSGPTRAALELVGRFETAEQENGPKSFEIVHRLTFYPDHDTFALELARYRNLAKKPVRLAAFFFRTHGAIAGSPDGDVPIKQDGVPRLWGSVLGDAWRDAKANVFWGLAAPDASPLRIRFWLNNQGGQHPDARWEQELELAAGETFSPARPIAVLSVAGRGDRLEWETKARAALDAVVEKP